MAEKPSRPEKLYRMGEVGGMTVCGPHLDELGLVGDEVIKQDEWYAYRCAMCMTAPAGGKICERKVCSKPLHPNWPAVYCSNECARLDYK